MGGAPTIIIEDVHEAVLASVIITGTPGAPDPLTGLQVTADRIETKLTRLAADRSRMNLILAAKNRVGWVLACQSRPGIRVRRDQDHLHAVCGKAAAERRTVCGGTDGAGEVRRC